MAAKVLFLLALVAAVAYATKDCKCDALTDEETTLTWEFFKQISAQHDPNNELLDFVLPGELSPLIDCDCVEAERRRKRKILPEVSEESEDSDDGTESIGGLRQTPKCPHGYVWFGILCVDEKLVMDRK